MVGTDSSEPSGDGLPGGNGLPFNFAALQNVLNDPNIKQMAEQIASAPEFSQMTQVRGRGAAACARGAQRRSRCAADADRAPAAQALQANMANGGGMAPGGAPPGGPLGGPALDPDAYAAAMTGVLQNPQFMQMAEQLGQQIMTVRAPARASGPPARGAVPWPRTPADARACAARSKTRAWRT